MAKFARYDPRNKKMGRNKVKALEKDLRMRPTEKKVKDLENEKVQPHAIGLRV